ncbi:LLM class F420-dependent oxidoreductase [Dictyobacter vulcani]|uniref:LLM class F420-dependent oxidoreductase n=1 Tax=Dictyobacter vulcani TaxID=2607529 RepID=A0A5J4KRP3_9CHLR|nr:LLM class flavin-dependent oxidoreductase [Dictyobacter vulcani]GER90323.1 LLM class F420-dependent oxidoreductase [Dictyobacter vulcani]
MAQVEFGWSMPAGNGAIDREAYRRAITKGLEIIPGAFDSAWLSDHLQSGSDDVLESWTALTYLAARHPELKFGHIVLCQLFRNPALLAKMAATFQYMSRGQLILGMGAGWNEAECQAYNIDFPPAGARVEELEEALVIIKTLWQQDDVTFLGKHHQVKHAYCRPRPTPVPPVMVAGSRPKMLQLTARYADWWNVMGADLDAVKQHITNCERACAEVGRNPATLRRTLHATCLCAPRESIVHELTASSKAGAVHEFIGTPKQVIDQMRPFIDIGIDYFILYCEGFPNLITLETLANDVIPHLSH